MCNLARCYLTGWHVPVSYAEAKKWFEKGHSAGADENATMVWPGLKKTERVREVAASVTRR